uniref:Uncharacterized protein n=1 Tax=Eutreptiella gymnastica TaxID=73025 RepID=A0A7S1J1M1_9EUGL|mmetsp:Transcript_58583/g.104499  ORF Transcript_58583/g.104499 Transcript_58583/m.104499 type:complete len:286 (+) Transcript_58583:25-882(+)
MAKKKRGNAASQEKEEELTPSKTDSEPMATDSVDRSTLKRRKISEDNAYEAVYAEEDDERERKTPLAKLWLKCELVTLMLRIFQAHWPGLAVIRIPELKFVNAFGNFDTDEQLLQALKRGTVNVMGTEVVCKDNRQRPNQTHKAYFEGRLYNVLRDVLRQHLGTEGLALGSVRRMDGCTVLVPQQNVEGLLKQVVILGCPCAVERQRTGAPAKPVPPESTRMKMDRIWKPKRKVKAPAPHKPMQKPKPKPKQGPASSKPQTQGQSVMRRALPHKGQKPLRRPLGS